MSWNVPFTTVSCLRSGDLDLRDDQPRCSGYRLDGLKDSCALACVAQFAERELNDPDCGTHSISGQQLFFRLCPISRRVSRGLDNTGELASSVPIHVMGDTSLPTGTSIPSTCSSVAEVGGGKEAGTEEDTIAALGGMGY